MAGIAQLCYLETKGSNCPKKAFVSVVPKAVILNWLRVNVLKDESACILKVLDIDTMNCPKENSCSRAYHVLLNTFRTLYLASAQIKLVIVRTTAW